ncbi:MAG: hypothetical protein Q4B96_07340 [Bacillota bacterium]|nr:hypothetical protein [Bacillota bacterium]
MHILFAIDDTDDRENPLSDEHFETISDFLRQMKPTRMGYPSIYRLSADAACNATRHNTAHVREYIINTLDIPDFIEYAQSFLRKVPPPTANPGLCVVEIERLEQPQKLIDFGRRACMTLLTKEDAYAAVSGEPHVHLSEHGGDGRGVIGALAACGLRLAGED